jgi:phytoene/squalene synthetase
MPKSYTEELAQWVNKRQASRARQDKNVVAFLALKRDVQAAMDAGYSLLTIWEHLHDKGKLPYRYETFLKHVRRHIKARLAAADDQPPDSPRSAVTGRAGAPSLQPPAKPAPPYPPAGFKFDAQPKKEDLL